MKIHKHSSVVLGITILTLCGLSCKKDNKSEKETLTPYHVVFEDAKIQQIYAQYLQVQMALVESAPKVVQKEAKQMANLIPNDSSFSSLKATTRLLYLTKDLAKQRAFFVGMTAAVESVVKTTVIRSGQIYKQFCPMAFEGEGGYWLSHDEEIRNPFYGDQMLHCGTTTEIIK